MRTVTHEEMSKLPKIVAVDFDGTIVEDRFPEIGKPINEMVYLLHQLQAQGIELILWTSRDGEDLQKALDFCKTIRLSFAAVNENHPAVKALFDNDTRKVYADLYIDDKAIPHTMSPSKWAERLGLRYTLEKGVHNGT